MTGTAVQLSSRALGCNWPGLTGHGGSCRTEQCVCVWVCVWLEVLGPPWSLRYWPGREVLLDEDREINVWFVCARVCACGPV